MCQAASGGLRYRPATWALISSLPQSTRTVVRSVPARAGRSASRAVEGERRWPTLVDIFVQVLDDPDGTAHLHVNMRSVTTGEVRVIRNDPTVIDPDRPTVHDPVKGRVRVVTPTIQRITILAHRGLLAERPGIAFGAGLLSIHARRLVVVSLSSPQGP